MKPKEMTNELLTRITRTTRVIRESFDDYDAKIPYPHNDINGGISNHSFRRFLRQYDAMWINFYKMNLFKAALTLELRSVVAQQEQETITIKRMYQVATTAQRELKGKGPALVNKIREEEIPTKGENNDVVAFQSTSSQAPKQPIQWTNMRKLQLQMRRLPNWIRTRRKLGQWKQQQRNGKYCYFCKIQGHRQEECRKRIKENKPCRNAQGRYYWPKVYFMEENEAKAINSIDHEEVRSLQGRQSI
jgi:hypothetical protein